MKTRLTIALLAFSTLLGSPAFAQNVVVGEPTAADIGKDQAQQLLKEVSVDKFEDAAYWFTSMPLDEGVVQAKRLVGSPAGKQPIADEAALGIKEDDKYVLGVKVSFFHRGVAEFTDFRGQRQELTVGTLNFIGWKKLTVAVPPSILQTDYHYAYQSGLRVTGLKVETDPMDSFGTYYIYFDDLRAVTDLFGESKRDTDDMSDGW